MRRWSALLCMISVLCIWHSVAVAGSKASLYQAVTIVTGQGAKNRQAGFKDCLDKVLVRVSGDQRLPKRPEMVELRARAGDFVHSYAYRDRLEGIPIHDEQGTYDRPHDLTCRYRQETIDRLLGQLESRPWLSARPKLMVFLDVQRSTQTYDVVADNDRDKAMREAFDAAAAPLAFTIDFPTHAQATALLAKSNRDRVSELEPSDIPSTDDVAVMGRLVWSDRDLGWVATWRIEPHGRPIQWTVRGVNFDEAFRVAVRGAAQVLSGNGNPVRSVRGEDYSAARR